MSQNYFQFYMVKKRFIQDLNSEDFYYENLLVINQSARKVKINFKKKKN